MSDSREQIEAAADRIREDLVTTLKELDRRRLQATDVGYQLRQHQDVLLAVGAGIVILAGAAVATGLSRQRRRMRHPLQRRAEALRRAWNNPERLATRAESLPGPMMVARKIAVAALIAFGTQMVRRAATELVPAKPKDPNQYMN